MKKLYILFLLSVTSLSLVAQDDTPRRKYPFVNITEVGGLFGRVNMNVISPVYYSTPSYSSYATTTSYGYYPTYGNTFRNVVNLTLQTYNGVYLDPKTSVGFTTGIDWYNATLVVPLAAGVRRRLVERRGGGAAIVAGLDAGYGGAFFSDANPEFKTSGGLLVNPMVGFRMPNRSGSAWVLNFGYKYQRVSVKYTGNNLDYYTSHETRQHNRLVVRFGFEF